MPNQGEEKEETNKSNELPIHPEIYLSYLKNLPINIILAIFSGGIYEDIVHITQIDEPVNINLLPGIFLFLLVYNGFSSSFFTWKYEKRAKAFLILFTSGIASGFLIAYVLIKLKFIGVYH